MSLNNHRFNSLLYFVFSLLPIDLIHGSSTGVKNILRCQILNKSYFD